MYIACRVGQRLKPYEFNFSINRCKCIFFDLRVIRVLRNRYIKLLLNILSIY